MHVAWTTLNQQVSRLQLNLIFQVHPTFLLKSAEVIKNLKSPGSPTGIQTYNRLSVNSLTLGCTADDMFVFEVKTSRAS